ncbi:PREDICTED: uncharacterized protein LOC104700973 [Camelina sativa]|uniref:Uncharacterized protein LOC104700973 n=1 Tax=Camelina sativa TaxID=90675 RepID=A0ABM0SR20_CAMSA|nr:PREDICTED: uncharacterized protein LOC104700973 [Camelina sativa]
MPSDDCDLWLKQFAQDFTWEPQLTSRVRREFDKEAATQYSNTLCEWKKKWKKGETPKGINEKVYEGLQEYWAQSKTKETATQKSKNQNSNRGGKGRATHNSGSTSHYTRGKQLTKRDGVAPDHLTLMEDTHTNKKTKQIQDPLAKEVIENSRKRMEEFRLSQPSADGNGSPTPIPAEMINQFVLEETPQTKGRIFGLGNVAKRLRTSSSPIYDR